MKFKDFFLNSIIIFAFLFLFFSCNKSNENKSEQKTTGKFEWKSQINVSDIPDTPVSGMLNGKEFKAGYINFERWRGSKDNVINFSLIKPTQDCGFIENFQGFILTRKAAYFDKGEFVKSSFDAVNKELVSEIFNMDASGNIIKYGNRWCGAFVIENIDQKKVTGKIALCFDDNQKSWIAGKFESIICNN